jgi:hypothetical protein
MMWNLFNHRFVRALKKKNMMVKMKPTNKVLLISRRSRRPGLRQRQKARKDKETRRRVLEDD